MLGASLEIVYGLSAEIVLNAIFCIIAGIVIILKEESVNEHKEKDT